MNEDGIRNSEPMKAGASSEMAAERVVVAEAAPTPTKKKGVNGMLVGLILCLVLAIGGVGFGVWAMMDGNTRVDELNNRIDILQAKNSEYMENLAELCDDGNENDGDGEESFDDEKNDDDGGESVISDSTNGDGYIYIEEWGLKIKIPENLKIISYKYGFDGEHTEFVIWGVDCSATWGCQYFPDFANSDKNEYGIGNIVRYYKNEELSEQSAPTLLFSDDKYNYYGYHPQAIWSSSEWEIGWESDSTKLIWYILKNPDNYSAI